MRLLKSRIRIADDLEGVFTGQSGLNWMYSPSEKRYYSFKSGEIYSRIYGKNIPDPGALFANRCNQLGVFSDSAEAIELKPTRDTYLLFSDWMNRNAELHD